MNNVSKRSSVEGVGINDGDGLMYTKNKDGVKRHVQSYSIWRSMLVRCYNEKLHEKNPRYKDCRVCDEWLYYSNFKKWFDKNYIKGYELDKDILVKGNKVYSDKTCCFVPREINGLTKVYVNKKSKLPTGVTQDRFSYYAAVCMNGSKVDLGSFKTKEEAHSCYVSAKEAHVKEKALAYYKEKKINIDVCNALLAWRY